MKLSHLIPALGMLGLLGTFSLAGCQKNIPDPAQQTACEAFAAHLATVVQIEQGEPVPKEQLDEMLAATTEACLASPPGKDAMACAMAAKDTKTMKACDPDAPRAQE